MMLFSRGARIYLATKPIDGRRSFNLTAVVTSVMHLDPLCCCLFVFYNKKRDLLKALYWDTNGFCLWQKRLEAGQFFIKPRDYTEASLELTTCQLQGLIQGIDWKQIEKPKELHYTLV